MHYPGNQPNIQASIVSKEAYSGLDVFYNVIYINEK